MVYTFQALRDYEPRISHYTGQLMQAIENELGTPMNVSRWFNYYSFDVMGDLSFGKSFNMLVDGKDSYVLTQLHGHMMRIGLFSHLTWLFPFFKRTPGLNAEYLKFWRWADGRVKERIQVSQPHPTRSRSSAGRSMLMGWRDIELAGSSGRVLVDPQGI